ncbi:MAG TPA: UdgX family uracil-DNA binding protein [Polyangiaceae bacterium]|nr:UdgX family uracil-DNA binding protein [Polyangiaceae bacterium]
MASRRTAEPGAERFMPERRSLKALREAAHSCEGCQLYRSATQTVFGEGAARARLMLVGEQPGDVEDREGHPFVGPAGKLLDKALSAAGIERDQVYLTNAVKHFKFERTPGKARLHKRPNSSEIAACVPWLHAELRQILPDVLVLLGATAAQALFGSAFRVTQQRGKALKSEWARVVIATAHPSAVLRAPDAAARAQAFTDLVADLRVAARALRQNPDTSQATR